MMNILFRIRLQQYQRVHTLIRSWFNQYPENYIIKYIHKGEPNNASTAYYYYKYDANIHKHTNILKAKKLISYVLNIKYRLDNILIKCINLYNFLLRTNS